MRNITAFGDLTKDGRSDLIATEKSTGKLYLYPGTSTGTLGSRKLIGTGGWNTMAHLVAVGDFNGTDAPDLLAVTNDAYTGDGSSYSAGWQLTYSGRGDGGLAAGRPVRDGWWGFTAFC